MAYDTDLFYLISDTEQARANFLKKICKEVKGYYKVEKDAKCRSASAAASYVLGCQADFNMWKDKQGKSLLDIYPNYFCPLSQKIEKKQKKDDSLKEEGPVKEDKKFLDPSNNLNVGRPPRLYYITRDNIGHRSCNAKGVYDKLNDKFTILEGSILANEVTASYLYTASYIKRKKFILLNCDGKYCHKLKRDVTCNSPDEAACFVLGEKANGWLEWKSKDGISLESYINKVQT